jgi:hypothetical protein
VVSDPRNTYTPFTVSGDTAFPLIEETGALTPQAGKKVQGSILRNSLVILNGLDSGLLRTIESVKAPDIVRTTLYTNDGIELDIGSAKNIQEKNQIILEVLKEQEGKVVLINVRTIEKPTWRGLSR